MIMPATSTVDSADFYQEHQYVILRRVLTAVTIKIIADYMLDIFREVEFCEGNMPSKYRYADPLGESLMVNLQPAVEAGAGLKLFPSFSATRIYGPNAELEPHFDKTACEIVASLNLAYFPDEAWPIYVKPGSDAEPVEVILAPGDMVVYRGHDFEHWREPFPGEQSLQMMFCYVNANGPHADLKYHRRERVGMLSTD